MNPHPASPDKTAHLPAQWAGGRAPVVASILVRPAALTATPNAMDLVRALRRRWAMALALGLVAAVVFGGGTYYFVPRAKYTATATLHVATSPRRIIFDPQENATDYKTYQKTQVALIKNRKVLSHALSRPEIAGLETVREQTDADEWLEQNLKAEFPGGSEVLQLSLSGDRSEDLARIVNAVVQSYMSVVVEQEYRERLSRLEALRTLREKYDAELKQRRKSLRDTVAAVGLTDQKALAMAQQFKTEHIGMAQRELMRARTELLKAESEVSVLQAAGPPQPNGATPAAPARPGSPGVPTGTGENAAVDRDPRVRDAEARVAEASRRSRDAARIVRDPGDASATRFRENLADATKALARVRAAVAAEMIARGERPGEPERPATLARAQGQVAVWKAYGEAMAEDLRRLQNEVKDTTDRGLDLENERGEIDIATSVSRKVGAEVEAVQVELKAPDRIRGLAEAKVPKKKDELRKLKAGGAAAAGAFACVLLVVSYREFLTRRIDSVDEVTNGLGIRLMGTVPALPRGSGRAGRAGASADRRWQNRLVESVDAMRAVLLHASRTHDIRSVMVTSAIKGEGKTSLSCQLATSMARAGRRTLLIDCDLRSPACHRLFDVDVEPGLCELLRGEIGLQDAVRPIGDSTPSLITAGRVDAMALQALSQAGLGPLLDELAASFDFIVVDSAPILLVADSLIVGQSTDAVIFSVMREVSRLPMIYAAHERLAGVGVEVLGAVVAGVPDVVSNYGYGYDHGVAADAH